VKRLAVAALAAFALAQPARAEHALTTLATGAAALSHSDHDERERRLANDVSALDGVASAAVQLTIADPRTVPLDAPLPLPRVALGLTLRGRGPTDEALFLLVQRALPALRRADLRVSRRAESPAAQPALARVGPFEVAAGSATPLRLALAGSLAMNAVLSGFLVWRTRAPKRRPARVARPRDR
jgi:hypothetical protein